jgi:hypothetical protein
VSDPAQVRAPTAGGYRTACLAQALVLLLLVAGTSAPAAAQGDPAEELRRATSAYERGDYAAAISALTPLLYPRIRLPDQDQAIAAYKLLGLSYLAQKDSEQAEKQFLAILSLRSSFRMDPLVDPVAAVQFFEEVKRRNADRIRAIQERERLERERRIREELRRREEQRRRAAEARKPSIERTVYKHPYWVNFVPLGAGQFQNGQRTKGYLLMGFQLALAAASAGTALASYIVYQRQRLKGETYDAGRDLDIVTITTGALALALYAYGVIDAMVYWRPQTVIERTIEHKTGAGELLKGAYVAPYVGPDGAGLGVGFSF